MKRAESIKTLDEIGFIGTQPKKRLSAGSEKKIAAKTRKSLDDYRNLHLTKKKAA